MVTLAKRIESARKSAGLTRAQLAELVGCKIFHLRDLESGGAVRHLPALLPKLAKALDKPISYFFSIEPTQLGNYRTAKQIEELIKILVRNLGE